MRWLDRDLVVGPFLGLATSEAAFHRAMKHCKIPRQDWPKWVSDNADATMHTLQNPDGKMVCVVSIKACGQSPIQIAAILVHEAVHVFQEHCARIGEHHPSSEFEAYSIQSIAQRLMQAYADSLAG